MNNDLITHPGTHNQLQQFIRSPYHAVLLAGPDGIGKTTLAKDITVKLLQLQPEKLVNYPYFLIASPGSSGNISIEAVRNIQKFLQLKTTGKAPLRRVAIIEHADGLTTEAQNALLKLLEEPPADTVLMLTVQSKRSLLPTIVSRVQTITVHKPDQDALQTRFQKAGKAEDITSAYFLSGGLPGLMSGLLDKENEHPLLAQVAAAKEILQKSAFERLAIADSLAKQKPELERLLEALLRIAASGINQTSEKQDGRALRRWHNIQKEVFYAQNALASSANSKLVLTKMLLHM